MATFRLNRQGWLSILVSPEREDRARETRAQRDRLYGNIYPEEDSDARWVGDLGEMVFNAWLQHEGIQGFEWILNKTAGQPDFVTALNIRIGVKAVKRKVPPREDYTAQITAQHAHEPTDHFFFMSYELAKRRMWLLGGIPKERFLREARYHKAGEWVHANYRIRAGHEIYNIDIANLVSPKDWIKQVT